MKRSNVVRWLNVLALIAMLVVNGLANALPINNLTTGEISDRFDVYFVPAAYVFSIWGLIYVALILFTIYQVLPSQRQNPRLGRIGYLFAFSCLANMTWLFFWHYELFALSLVAMFALLITLITIYLRLDIGRAFVSTTEKWLVDVPFSLYLGWITVATIANVTSFLDYINWGGWGISPEWWTVIMLLAATAIASAMSFTRGDIAYMLVIIWAFVGIALRHAGTPIVAPAAWVAVALVAVMTVAGKLSYTRRRQAHHAA
ncbi:MAG: tryptophan-rich sensory protein [Chloroflexota bacterium]